jgi:hypothetical protein
VYFGYFGKRLALEIDIADLYKRSRLRAQIFRKSVIFGTLFSKKSLFLETL